MKKPYTVGISGGSSSGKSTLQDILAEKLNDLKVKSFHMDDYFKEASKRPVITGFPNGKQYADDNHPQTLYLDRFYADFENALGQDWDVILVEGVFVLWEERILSRLDLKLYVDCDPDERLARRIKRHLAYGDELDEILERYVNAVKPRHMEYVEPTKWKADLILNGFCMPPMQLEILTDWIRKSAAK